MSTIADIVHHLDQFAPVDQAAEWDNVGLLLGDACANVAKIMTCLTITPNVVAEAVENSVDLIVCHHPVLFRPIKKLTAATPDGRLLLPLLRAGIAVYSPHTAFDNCKGGINDWLCQTLGIVDSIQPLRMREGKRSCKLVVFVPDTDLNKVSKAVFEVGGGVIGKYSQCSFRQSGIGTFFGDEGSNPTIGQPGRREEAPEWRLEILVPEAKIDRCIQAVRRAHSYEEPAFDLYPLRGSSSNGEGRIGNLNQPVTLGTLAKNCKAALGASGIQYCGDPGKLVTRIALACGAAGEFLSDAIRGNADVFITGEMRFHDVLTAQSHGLGLILPGHYATERPAIEELAKQLATAFPALHVFPSALENDPLVSI